MNNNDALRGALEHYDKALLEAFPFGAKGVVFHHWNEARKAITASKPEPQARLNGPTGVSGTGHMTEPQAQAFMDAVVGGTGVLLNGERIDPANIYKEPQAQANTEQSERAEFDRDPLETAIDNFVAEYELNDGEAFHVPSEFERLLIKDAIMGLLVDEEWDKAWGEHISSLAAALLATDKAGGEWSDDVMRQWDYWRAEIASGNKTSAPRDWFESLAEHPHPQPSALPDDVVKDAHMFAAGWRAGLEQAASNWETWYGFDKHGAAEMCRSIKHDQSAIDAAMLKERK